MAVMRALVFLCLIFSVESVPAQEGCPNEWVSLGVQCYKFFFQSVDWVTAEKNCQSINANLASVHDTVEHNFVLTLLPANTPAWIGGHDGEVDGRWLWSDGSKFEFTSWCSGEPNNYQGKPEDCIMMNFSTNRCWNDAQCGSTMGYICTKPRLVCGQIA